MAKRTSLGALNRRLQDLSNFELLMGGVTTVLSGNFHQTLPVIPKATKTDELAACLKFSYLWRHVTKMSLRT